jgi:hypothetical protein
MGLALQLEVTTVAVASIPGRKVGEKCCNSGLDGRLEAVATSIHMKVVAASIQLGAAVVAMRKLPRETLPTASRVLGPYENPIT